ncbi:Flp family type IVb pilin [Qipengyuania spongiae]|uniref:Flp family type IVb pilin n=1 Tax=Qipengyuania spongiae TaxID=2909673 RepID=A0ABY5SX62_9SPHN|nr:Flp family type IVb pilin [Qipengyuania spongiae]UVI39135.1 Flp family type IVb pilin [Qipengyuania spongiae]
MTFFKKLARDEQAATAIEYGLIAALIAVAAMTAMGALGDNLESTFLDVSTCLENPDDASCKTA